MALTQGTTSSTFLLDGLSFNATSNNADGSNVTVNRTPTVPFNNSELDFSSSFSNADGSVQWADIDLNTSQAFQKGAPDVFMGQLKNNPAYQNTIKNASEFLDKDTFGNPKFGVDPNLNLDGLSGAGALNSQQEEDSKKGGSSDAGSTLVYPESRSAALDYLKVTVIEYAPPGLPTGGSFSSPSTESAGRKKSAGKTIFLPMHPAISDSNSVSWNQDSLNPFQMAAAGSAMKAIEGIGNADFMGVLQGLASDVKNFAQNIADTGGMPEYIRAYFAGQAVGANVVGRASGAVLNNNLELLFQGPTLRTFNYRYKFTPRSSSEANTVKEIIRTFKTEMAVRKGKTNLFLVSPNVFALEYIFGKTGSQHPFMNQIKTCALTNFTVDYTPDGSYMTYQDGSMTSYNVNLQFSELEPIYRDDQENAGGTGY